jgi:hypothetical protein
VLVDRLGRHLVAAKEVRHNLALGNRQDHVGTGDGVLVVDGEHCVSQGDRCRLYHGLPCPRGTETRRAPAITSGSGRQGRRDAKVVVWWCWWRNGRDGRESILVPSDRESFWDKYPELIDAPKNECIVRVVCVGVRVMERMTPLRESANAVLGVPDH